MERMLLKMARQLNDYDEASLMALWERYATLVQEFEPSRRWEEAALVLSMIQGVRFKNQLFNKHLVEQAVPDRGTTVPEWVREASAWSGFPKAGQETKAAEGDAPGSGRVHAEKRRKVLHFTGRKGDKPV